MLARMSGAPDLVATLQAALASRTAGLSLVNIARGSLFLDDQGNGDAAWLLLSGRARVFRIAQSGDMVVLAHRVAGELIGELALIDGGPRSGSALALEPLEAIRITPACFAALLSGDAGFAHAVSVQLARRLRETSDRAFAIAAAPIAARVASELLRLGRANGSGQLTVADAPSVTDLAVAVHATREHVSRLLSDWRQRGLVQSEGRTMVIHDAAALSDLMIF